MFGVEPGVGMWRRDTKMSTVSPWVHLVRIPGGHGVGAQNLLPHSGLLLVNQGCIGLELCSLLESLDSHLTEHLLPGGALHDRKITASLLLPVTDSAI